MFELLRGGQRVFKALLLLCVCVALPFFGSFEVVPAGALACKAFKNPARRSETVGQECFHDGAGKVDVTGHSDCSGSSWPAPHVLAIDASEFRTWNPFNAPAFVTPCS